MNIVSRFRGFLRNAWVGINRALFSEVLVIGDSHAMVFKHWAFRLGFPGHYFNVTSVGGATATGLSNQESNTKAGQIFVRQLGSARGKKIFFILGEVDTGYLIWHRASRAGASVEDCLRVAVKNYCELLERAPSAAKVTCISAPLPTIRDGSVEGAVAEARRSVTATQKERTKLTLEFNARVQEYCSRNAISFLSLDDASLGEDGVVVSGLLNQNPGDHHYNQSAYARLIIKALKVNGW